MFSTTRKNHLQGDGMMKIAFLDRDGTIIRDYPDAMWRNISKPEILDGAIPAMKHLIKRGYQIILITNQYIIGEGIITKKQYEHLNDLLLSQLKKNHVEILDVFYCPHARSDQCDCCKPKTGLIKQALDKYPSINLSESFLCGDSINDLLCAETVGLTFYGIQIGKHSIRNLSDLCSLIS